MIYGGVIGAVATFIACEYDMDAPGRGLSVIFRVSRALRVVVDYCCFVCRCLFFLQSVYDRRLRQGMSTNLGLNHPIIVGVGLIIVALISAIVVVDSGAIPFIGLVVPKYCSRLMGDNVRKTLP